MGSHSGSVCVCLCVRISVWYIFNRVVLKTKSYMWHTWYTVIVIRCLLLLLFNWHQIECFLERSLADYIEKRKQFLKEDMRMTPWPSPAGWVPILGIASCRDCWREYTKAHGMVLWTWTWWTFGPQLLETLMEVTELGEGVISKLQAAFLFC